MALNHLDADTIAIIAHFMLDEPGRLVTLARSSRHLCTAFRPILAKLKEPLCLCKRAAEIESLASLRHIESLHFTGLSFTSAELASLSVALSPPCMPNLVRLAFDRGVGVADDGLLSLISVLSGSARPHLRELALNSQWFYPSDVAALGASLPAFGPTLRLLDLSGSTVLRDTSGAFHESPFGPFDAFNIERWKAAGSPSPWCSSCGQHRLVKEWQAPSGARMVIFECPGMACTLIEFDQLDPRSYRGVRLRLPGVNR